MKDKKTLFNDEFEKCIIESWVKMLTPDIRELEKLSGLPDDKDVKCYFEESTGSYKWEYKIKND